MSNQNVARVDYLFTRGLDFHGRRISNASDAVEAGDYVTLRQLNDRIAKNIPGVFSFHVGGVLAIGGDIADRVFMPAGLTINTVVASVKRRSTGAPIIFELVSDEESLGTFTLPAERSKMESFNLSISVKRGSFVRLDITSVGVSSPGSDLDIFVLGEL